jgi:O-antigen ligase
VRALGAAIALSIFSALLLRGTEWVSGWLACGTGLAVVTYFANRRLLLVAAAVLVVYVLARPGYFYEQVYLSNFYIGRSKTGNDRSEMVRAAVLYATKFPLGIGLGNYRQYNLWYGSKKMWDTTSFSSAHGTIGQTLSETGFLGLLTLLVLLASVVRMLYGAWRVLPVGPAKSYTLGALGGVLGIYASSAFNGDYIFPTYHNGGMGTFSGAVYQFFLIGIAGAIAREHGIVFGAAAPTPASLPPDVPAAPTPQPSERRATAAAAEEIRRPVPLIHRRLGGPSVAGVKREPHS